MIAACAVQSHNSAALFCRDRHRDEHHGAAARATSAALPPALRVGSSTAGLHESMRSTA